MIATNQTPETATGNAKLAENLQFYDKRDISRMTKFSPRMIDHFMAQGMPHLKIGKRRVRFDMLEVHDWLKQRYSMQCRRGKVVA